VVSFAFKNSKTGVALNIQIHFLDKGKN